MLHNLLQKYETHTSTGLTIKRTNTKHLLVLSVGLVAAILKQLATTPLHLRHLRAIENSVSLSNLFKYTPFLVTNDNKTKNFALLCHRFFFFFIHKVCCLKSSSVPACV
jgi:hypothetical protein